uniref:hypothetical protein n=1 Tax=Acinetobacter brisouii TaxID=396323 RepID=UPI00124BF657
MNLNTYLQQLDLAKLDLHPLNDHYIADHLNEQEKELYLTMVSSFVLFDDLTEARTRLFGLYLNSCKTKLQQGKIFNLAQNISKEQIKEFSQLCILKKLKNSFLIDAFIFLRLDVPLNDRKNILLSEWINLLKINQENLEELLYIVSEVLGIKHDFKINSSFNLSQANIWKEFIIRELTLDQLKESELQGFWLVKKDIEVNFNCSLNNINLYFENNSILKFKENLEVKLIQSKFHNSLLYFNKVDKLLIDSCSFIGNYDVKKKFTVLKINAFEGEDSNCEINHCYFETKDAQAISATRQRKFNFFRTALKKLSIENTKFNHCGNKLLLGGVAFLKDINFKFKEVTIENCIALVSGGIYTSALY